MNRWCHLSGCEDVMLTGGTVIYMLELCSFCKNYCIKGSAGDVFYISHYYHLIKALTRAARDYSKWYKLTQTFLSYAKPPKRWKLNVYFWIHPSKLLLKGERVSSSDLSQLCHRFSHGNQAERYCCWRASFYSTESQTDGLTATNTTNLLLYWPLHTHTQISATASNRGPPRCIQVRLGLTEDNT